VAGGGEFPLHVIDREIAFAHGYGQITNAVARGSGLRSTLREAEEGGALIGVMAELMAEDAEGGRGVAKTAGDVAGGLFIDEESAESFVLALQGELRGEEEFLVRMGNYLIHSTGWHDQIVLQKHLLVNMFLDVEGRTSKTCKQARRIMHILRAAEERRMGQT
jgi:hypothetical protein